MAAMALAGAGILFMIFSIRRSWYSSPPRYLDFMMSASKGNLTDPHIGRLVYKPATRADVLKGAQLPLSLKALLSAGGDEQGMIIQQARRNILARKFCNVISHTVKLCSRSLSPSQPITHP